jgi:hypothetical protein
MDGLFDRLGRFLLTIAALWAANGAVLCPIDNSQSYFTGKTTVESGKLLMQHKCPSGHLFWVVK